MDKKFLSYEGLSYLWTQLKALFNGKVDKEEGKGLSTNDYTTDEKNKLAGIDTGANKTVINDTVTSESTEEALSAAKGKYLNDRIDSITLDMENKGAGDMLKATYDADNDGKVDVAKHAETADSATNADDAAKLGGQSPEYYAKASDIPTVPTNVSAFTNDANYLTKTGDATDVTATFTPASERTNITTGEKLTAILGKIAKFFADLKTVAFTGSYNDLTDKPSIPTVTNDLTNELKANYDAAYNHSQEDHAPANAQANVIESISVNGTAQAVTGKGVNITVPTTVAALTDAADYAKKTDLTNVYQYAGSVATYADLPTGLGAVTGTCPVYNVEADGMNYAWNGTAWDNLGQIFEIESISNSDIDTILAS